MGQRRCHGEAPRRRDVRSLATVPRNTRHRMDVDRPEPFPVALAQGNISRSLLWRAPLRDRVIPLIGICPNTETCKTWVCPPPDSNRHDLAVCGF